MHILVQGTEVEPSDKNANQIFVFISQWSVHRLLKSVATTGVDIVGVVSRNATADVSLESQEFVGRVLEGWGYNMPTSVREENGGTTGEPWAWYRSIAGIRTDTFHKTACCFKRKTE